MAQALIEMLGDQIVGGAITCPEGTTSALPDTWRQFHGGHPLPNSDSLAAAEAAFTILDHANAERATLIFAVSGGGSAMMEWPVNSDISLSDLQQANRVLVTSGAPIAEVNTIRRAFSAVKGGKLASRAPNAESITLIISDTNRGDEANVASGPTLPASKSSTANEIVQRFKLESKLPASVLRAIGESTELPLSPSARASHYVLADNRTALESAATYASSIGFQPVIAESISEQQIEQGCRELLIQLKELPPPACLISGGEFSCPVVGEGLGGRNSETVLRCVEAIASEESDIVVLSVGTDGIDGSSPAAGAMADNETLPSARALGLSVDEYLKRSDSYSFFSQLGDAIVTGPTGTNVRDLRILLKN